MLEIKVEPSLINTVNIPSPQALNARPHSNRHSDELQPETHTRYSMSLIITLVGTNNTQVIIANENK